MNAGAILALTLCAAQPQKPGGESAALPPLKPIAGIAGFECSSRLVFAEAPERPHRLVATHVFPARARWSIVLERGGDSSRAIQYQSADRFWLLDEGQARSRELAAGEREQVLAVFELRRALFLWPDGFDWRDGPEGSRIAPGSEGGVLNAGLGADGKPQSIAWCRADGGEGPYALRGVEWNAGAGRAFPRKLELWDHGQLVFREEVLSVVTSVRYLDAFFTPPDRRTSELPAGQGVAVRPVDLPSACVRRIALPADCDWRGAVESAGRARTAEAKGAGGPIAPADWFEVGPRGRPTAALLHLVEDRADPPAGWERSGERTGVAMQLESTDQVDATALARLAAAVAAPARALTPYVRLQAGAGGRAVMLVMPLAPR